MKDEKKDTVKSNDEEWAFIIVILLLCVTIVFVTRIYADAYLLGDMINHYTLRGKDVIVENEQLVFVN